MKEIDRIDNYIKGESLNDSKLVFTIRNVDNPEIVLEKAKEIMKIISQYAYTNTWLNDEEWKTTLPVWFVESMTLKTSEDRDRDDNLWHFESWIESMYHRAWEWYSSKTSDSSIEITIKLLNIPFIFEQFLYIFYAQGIPMDKMSDKDDIYGFTQYG